MRFVLWSLAIASAALAAPRVLEAPVVVYGAGSAGTGAALTSAALGEETILVAEETWLGGMMTSGGIGVFDGNPLGHSLGLSCGVFGEFKQRLADLYPEHGSDIAKAYRYEPAVGARVLDEMARELPKLRILRNTRLLSARVEGDRVVSLEVTGDFTGTVRGKVFIDGTDTGLLAARAGVPYRLGTDDTDGIVMAYSVRATFQRGPGAIQPFPTDPATGRETAPPHYADSYAECVREVQWRWLARQEMGTVPEPPGVLNPWGNLPILDPRERGRVVKWDINGDANDITLDTIARQLAGDPEVGAWFRDEAGRPIARRACLDAIEDDPSLDEARRELLIRKVEGCIRASSLGVLYYLRNEMRELGGAQWGLADDYGTPDGLPRQVYRREGRRIVGEHTLTERELCPSFDEDFRPGEKSASSSEPTRFADAIAVGDYAIDFHKVSEDTGNVWFALPPYQVPFGILVPANRANLLVGSAVSATHAAYGTLRMDPLRMLMGEACATAAHLALARQSPRISQVPIDEVQSSLIAQGSMLHYFADVPYDPISGGMTLGDLFIPTQVLALRAGLSGYADHTIRRHELLSRAQLAKLLVAAAGLHVSDPASAPRDCRGHWAAGEIATLVARGVLPCRADGGFGPDEPTTRGEAALAVWRMPRSRLGAPVPGAYRDVDETLRPAVEWLAGPCRQDGAAIFAGVAPGLFAPEAPLARGEALRLIQRTLLPLPAGADALGWARRRQEARDAR